MRYRLFDLPDLRVDEPDPPPASYGRRVTARNNRLISVGINPGSGRRLLVEIAPSTTLRCKDCEHAVPTGRNIKTYWKCAKNPRGMTRGLATDVRLKWPACQLFERRRTDVPSESAAPEEDHADPEEVPEDALSPGQ